ncbi:CRISPR-associated protein Csx16 [Acinetobacter sp. NIPH 1869]|uniref:CRISPR-associated protein Csx16 n=1 Tax=Acinetobacter higginsii TaxID=70347 RepID=UPI001F4B10F4|nr:CRISPR-associated protein Csx16 [Acinetobacter higginsii]MCH7306325.1 CRISPR-associated protein Csx16 [Acinetobacter higginsii]
MTIYFITRHPGALQWAKQNQLHFDVHLEHLLDLEQLHAGDTIIGTLPINIVEILNSKGIRYIHLSLKIPPHLRGIELDAKQLIACQATLEEFFVQKQLLDLKI